MKKPTLTFTYETDHWAYDFEAELSANQGASLIAAVSEFLSRFAVEFQEMVPEHNHGETE